VLVDQFKQNMGWVGSQSGFLSPFSHSGGIKILGVEQVGTNNLLNHPDCML